MNATRVELLDEVRQFRQAHPEVRFVDLICLDIPGHFYGKRYPIEMLEKVAAGSALKLPQNCVLLGAQGGLYEIGDYCFHDGDPDAPRRLIPGTLKPVNWERQPLGQMLISSDGTEAPIEFEPREVLARVVERLAARGIRPVVAFELEFYLFDKALRDGLPQYPRDDLSGDADDQPNMHIERLSRFADVLDDITETARLQGIDTTVITAEIGRGSSRSTSAITPIRCRLPTGRSVLPADPWRGVEAWSPRQLHGQTLFAVPGQRHACARQPVRRSR